MKKYKSKEPEQSNIHQNKPLKSNKGIATNFAESLSSPKKWYEELPEEPADFVKVSEEKLIDLKNEAKKCNDTEVATYSIKNSKTNSDYQWMKTVMSKGTVSDKVAAYTLLVQDDPVCNLATLRNLISMVKVGKKKECLIVIDTLSELFISDLLRPEAKLKPFYERPLSKLDELSSGSAAARRKYLSLWYFEDQLKECYTSFVQALNTAAHDSVDANKEKAINAMFKLLAGNPEQEKNLLSHIVNKLGDPSQKVASKAIYCLGQLLQQHPNMKQIVLNEIERLLFRANISSKAQYYSICFLSQFYLSHEDYDVAKNLIRVYFAFFKGCIKKGEVDTRLMSALLMGVNRAYPYAKSELTKISEHIDTMYKVVHVATFNVSLHALNLLYQVSDHNDSINDRFYTALYKKIQNPQLGTTTHQALFLNLVFRALKRDKDVNRKRVFIKRLLQIAENMQPAMACGILYLVNQLMYKNTHLLAIKTHENVVIDNEDEPEHYDDVKNERETEKNKVTGEDADKEAASDESEKNEKISEANMIDSVELADEDVKPDIKVFSGGSWYHCGKAIKSEYTHAPVTCYSPLQRNPLYAGGEFCVYTELLNLQKHFHPTVALFANKIINAQNISYSGDPLKDFTLIRFLERFAFKNPKKTEDVQKPGVNTVLGKRKLYVPSGIKSFAVDSKNYLNTHSNKIPVEELFMFTYLQRRQRERATTEKDDDSDLESVDDDEFEAMLDRMSGGKKLNDEELDFMNDVGDSLKNTKKGKKGDDDDDDDDSDEDMTDEDDFFDQENDFGDEGNDFGDEDIDEEDENEEGFNYTEDIDDEDVDGSDFGDDEEEIVFDSDDEDNSYQGKKQKKKGKNKDLPVFADADEFASMLDEDADFMQGTSNAVSNKDNAHIKQLSWEQNRNRWIKGMNKPTGKHGKKIHSKDNPKKRQKKKQFGNSHKKQKRH